MLSELSATFFLQFKNCNDLDDNNRDVFDEFTLLNLVWSSTENHSYFTETALRDIVGLIQIWWYDSVLWYDFTLYFKREWCAAVCVDIANDEHIKELVWILSGGVWMGINPQHEI